jgi:hypothetical protein
VLRCKQHFVFLSIQGIKIRTVLQQQFLPFLLQGLLPVQRREPEPGVNQAAGILMDTESLQSRKLSRTIRFRFLGNRERIVLPKLSPISRDKQIGLKEAVFTTELQVCLYLYNCSFGTHSFFNISRSGPGALLLPQGPATQGESLVLGS